MKRWINLVAAALVTVVSLSVAPVFAQEISHSVAIKRDAKVGDQVLPKGVYVVKYVDGKDELAILRGKQEILKATFKVTRLEKAAPNTVVIYAQDGGSFTLKRIEFKGTDSALVFENTVATASAKQ